ncbi:MAG TPA: hypothetical protein VMY35_18930 [Phycisphaerae bacterium]|nr:hypothetical protein [Phycisphaerae bacterium]
MTWMIEPETAERFSLFCRDAARSDAMFADFRERATMAGVVESVTREEANHFRQDMESRWQGWFSDSMPVLRDLDAIGRAPISPTMTRYAYRARDLNDWRPLDGARIVEIGGGYGGLAAVIHKFFKPQSYKIADIGYAQQLQARFLREAGVECVEFLYRNQSPGNTDLLIADFSICELGPQARGEYANTLFPVADYGAVIWSEMPSHEDWLAGDAVGLWLQRHLGGKRIVRPRVKLDQFMPDAYPKWWGRRWYWEPEVAYDVPAPKPEPIPEPPPELPPVEVPDD